MTFTIVVESGIIGSVSDEVLSKKISKCKKYEPEETSSSYDNSKNSVPKIEDAVLMDGAERVKRLKEYLAVAQVDHSIEVMKLNSLKMAHVYCVLNNLSAQKYGPMLEKFIRIKFNYAKNKPSDSNGDCSGGGNNMEIKVSLGGSSRKKFNFVQIRPSHDCSVYILTAYNLSYKNVENEGDLYIFKITKEELKPMIVSYGSYAHGTIKKQGKITLESLTDEKNNMEYALRPTLDDKCWKSLMPFRVAESAL